MKLNSQTPSKHANASEAEITFYIDSEFLLLEIADNSRGIKKHKSSKSFGLDSIQSRTASLNGKLSVVENQAGGTVISCSFPLINCGTFRKQEESFSAYNDMVK